MAQKATTKKRVLKKEPAAKKPAAKATNKETITQKVISNRVLKYKYPRGMYETLKRKAFRQQVRNQLRKFERDIIKAKGKDKSLLKEKSKAYQIETLM